MRAAKTKDISGGSALRSMSAARVLRLVGLAVAGLAGLWLLSALLSEGGVAGALPSSFRAKRGSGRERAAAAAAARAVQEAYQTAADDGGARRGGGAHAHAPGEDAQDAGDFVADTHGAAGAPAGCDNPPSTALGKAFATERFTLEKIVQRPGLDDWRLCYPGPGHVAGTPNPKCPTAEFFIVNQRDSSSDGVVDWLQGAEEHVMDLFSAVMSTTLGDTCKLRPNEKDCFVTAGSFPEAKRDKLLFLDIGSNHGFFTGYAAGAAPWLTAYAFEPQPQCAEFIELAVEASGFRDRVMVLNNLAGTTALAAPAPGHAIEPVALGRFLIPPRSVAHVDIPARTGCRGTWPTYLPQEEALVKQQYGAIPGALDAVHVTYVDPGTLVHDDHWVLLAKVDVEGFEEEVLDSLTPLIKRRRLFNILMELNKPQKLRRLGLNPDNMADPVVVDWVTKMLKRLQDAGYTLVPQWTGYKNHVRLGTEIADLRTFAEVGWNSVDIWAYMPIGDALSAPASAPAAAPAAADPDADAHPRRTKAPRRKAKSGKKGKKARAN